MTSTATSSTRDRSRSSSCTSPVPDLAKYPEFVWLDKQRYLPAAGLAIACFLLAGWSGLVVGFFWSTVLLFHCTFFINSLAHVYGTRRYVTGDDSRNNWWLALLTFGDGWHNNHHAYMASARQGFRWWEVDVAYYVLRALSWAGVVWDLNESPAEVVRNEKTLGRGAIEKVARQLAARFPAERIAAGVREAWARMPTLEELRQHARAARSRAVAMLADMHPPHLPSVQELCERAAQMFGAAPSLDDIAARARELILEAVAAELAEVV
jgi:stearoyl-CoA desaturase (Delta-9 desaturase)